MPIRIRRHDKTDVKMQISDISIFIIETLPFPSASYTANIAVFGVLYRSI
jgi:hypothetical protein